MEYFTILGERNSGTNFLQHALLSNFKIKHSQPIHKHFFGHKEFTENMDNTLYICIIRDPVEWIDSFSKRLHHIPPENKKLNALLNNEFYSIHEDGPLKGKEIMEDRNIFSKERYKNIFELRKTKNDYFLNISKKVKYYYILRYEDLNNDYENVLNKLANQFQLTKKVEVFVKVPKYKGTYNELYCKKPILLPYDIQEYIKQKVDIEQEHKLGYLLDITPLI